MKKWTVCILTMSLTVLLCGAAYADSCGNMLVPDLMYKYGSNTQPIVSTIALSNITDQEVEVTVDFYDQDGNLVEDKGVITKGSNTSHSPTVLASNTNTFTIPAHGTRSIKFYVQSGNYVIEGHAIVRWTSLDSSISKALIGRTYTTSFYKSQFFGWTSSLINSGQPF